MHYRANPQPASYCTTCWYETPETTRDHNKIVPPVCLLYSGPRESTMGQRHSNQAPSLTLTPVKLSWGQVADIAQQTFSIRNCFAYLYNVYLSTHKIFLCLCSKFQSKEQMSSSQWASVLTFWSQSLKPKAVGQVLRANLTTECKR